MIDVSRATLDVIEAVKTKQIIKFDYGHDVIREIKPWFSRAAQADALPNIMKIVFCDAVAHQNY